MGKQQVRSPDVGGISAGHLKSFIERAERLNEIKKEINADLKDLFAEIRSAGFDSKQVKRVLAYRAKDPDVVSEEDTIFDLYLRALGHLPSLDEEDGPGIATQAHDVREAAE